jgi:hypothetical protein
MSPTCSDSTLGARFISGFLSRFFILGWVSLYAIIGIDNFRLTHGLFVEVTNLDAANQGLETPFIVYETGYDVHHDPGYPAEVSPHRRNVSL